MYARVIRLTILIVLVGVGALGLCGFASAQRMQIAQLASQVGTAAQRPTAALSPTIVPTVVPQDAQSPGPTNVPGDAVPRPTAALAPTIVPTGVPQEAESQGAAGVASDAVAELNRFRAAANLPPVTPAAGTAAFLHAHYLALNKGTDATAGLNVHTEQAGLPGYTSEGATVAQHSNISQTKSTVGAAVRGLVDVPLHRHAMLSPALTTVGAGGEDDFWVIDLSSENRVWQGKPAVVPYPAPGQQGVPLAFGGHEIPNPLAAVPGLAQDATVGYPITLDFYACSPQGSQARASLRDGSQDVPIYLIQPGTTVRAQGGERQIPSVLIFPRAPLRPSTMYTVEVNTRCGSPQPQTYTWSFATRAAVDPKSAPTAVTAPGSDGWQPVSIQILDTDGRPVEGAGVTRTEWSSTAPVAGPARRPQERAVQDETAEDGELRLEFNLAGAPTATLQVEVSCDGQTIKIPVQVTPMPQGPMNAVSPADAAIRVDNAARSEWLLVHGP
jgi:uncharacterized protein YkwD